MKTIEDIIANIPSIVDNAKSNLTNSVIQLLIEGNNGGNWYIKIKDGSTTLNPGYYLNPDLSITCTFENFMNLSCGELDPGKAFMTGKLTIHGDKTIALQLLTLLQSKEINN